MYTSLVFSLNGEHYSFVLILRTLFIRVEWFLHNTYLKHALIN
uniref:Uncharacterized protein n=1 Tax=Rhizophora mucronata TaxID=61149 RepID=A0A2P2QKG2_RHIMU